MQGPEFHQEETIAVICKVQSVVVVVVVFLLDVTEQNDS